MSSLTCPLWLRKAIKSLDRQGPKTDLSLSVIADLNTQTPKSRTTPSNPFKYHVFGMISAISYIELAL